MANLSYTTEQAVHVTVNPTTASGAPAQFEGRVQAKVLAGPGATSETDSAGNQLPPNEIRLLGDAGSSQYVVFIDADLGAGVVEVGNVYDCEVTNPMATNLGDAAVIEDR